MKVETESPVLSEELSEGRLYLSHQSVAPSEGRAQSA